MSAQPLAIAADHPAFEGHFPGRPIVPAVVLLAEALAAITTRTGTAPSAWRLQQAKFTRSVAPGEPLTLQLDEAAGGMRFEIRGAGSPVANGQFARP